MGIGIIGSLVAFGRLMKAVFYDGPKAAVQTKGDKNARWEAYKSAVTECCRTTIPKFKERMATPLKILSDKKSAAMSYFTNIKMEHKAGVAVAKQSLKMKRDISARAAAAETLIKGTKRGMKKAVNSTKRGKHGITSEL